jgi:hypothetical protein
MPGIWVSAVTKENGPAFVHFGFLFRKFCFFIRRAGGKVLYVWSFP